MAFKEDIQALIAKLLQNKNYINNEEGTKQSLILPLIKILDYDVINPIEVVPEYVAAFGKKKDSRVDYAIFQNNKSIIFIEAKSINEKLENHDTQLKMYFNSTPEVKIGILTNGLQYKFFTDINTLNVMDSKPFFELDIENIKDIDLEILQMFRKDNFSINEITNKAKELTYINNIRKNLKELFENPSDDFIKLIAKDFIDKSITKKVIEELRPMIKDCMNKTIIDMVSDSISKKDNFSEVNLPVEEINSKIITTEEELQVFEIVKKALSKNDINIDKVNFNYTQYYLSIYNNNLQNWFVRVWTTKKFKYISTKLTVEEAQNLAKDFEVTTIDVKHGNSKIILNNFTDLEKLDMLILNCFKKIEN